MSSSIPKVAAKALDGTYSVRTRDLHAQRHAEIEVAPLPHVAIEAAAKLLDYVVEAVIGRGKRLEPGQNVGVPLGIDGHEDIPALFLGVRAVEHEAPTGGFFAKVRGTANYGVLRLTDLPWPNQDTSPTDALEALATLMLYRANCRLVTGDNEGALQELRDSLALAPGNADDPPSFAPPDDSTLNWQNHLTYLRLAELTDVDSEREACRREAYTRFPWLARRELGCLPADLTELSEPALVEDVKNLIAHNLEYPHASAGPHEAMCFLASPIWFADEHGDVGRAPALVPVGFVDYYFGGRLAEPEIADALALLAARCILRYAAAPWELAAHTKDARQMYAGPSTVQMPGAAIPYRPWQMLASAVVAEAARYMHAGATLDELHAIFGLRDEPALVASLRAKVEQLGPWETSQYMAALGVPS